MGASRQLGWELCELRIGGRCPYSSRLHFDTRPVTGPPTEERDGPCKQWYHLSPACQPLIKGVPVAELSTWPHSTRFPRKPFFLAHSAVPGPLQEEGIKAVLPQKPQVRGELASSKELILLTKHSEKANRKSKDIKIRDDLGGKW